MAEQTGTIKAIKKETITSKDGSKTFDKTQLILGFTTGQGEHTRDQSVPFTFFGKPAAAVNSFMEGEEVKITYDLSGREYNGKHYVELSAWKIEMVGEKKSSVGNGPVRNEAQPQPASQEDDLPF
jgi:hypothetical protein